MVFVSRERRVKKIVSNTCSLIPSRHAAPRSSAIYPPPYVVEINTAQVMTLILLFVIDRMNKFGGRMCSILDSEGENTHQHSNPQISKDSLNPTGLAEISSSIIHDLGLFNHYINIHKPLIVYSSSSSNPVKSTTSILTTPKPWPHRTTTHSRTYIIDKTSEPTDGKREGGVARYETCLRNHECRNTTR